MKKITNLAGFQLFSHQRRKKNLIKLILQTFPKGSSILDVGCASGDISVELSLHGYRVHGIDIEPNRLCRSSRTLDLTTHVLRDTN
ncbi:MAG: methyltransferase domain-containing protein, partial [Desulfobacterales bacterium]|nr:methyltransferase domain-containing protein [Candidatus Desulfatibia vada]